MSTTNAANPTNKKKFKFSWRFFGWGKKKVKAPVEPTALEVPDSKYQHGVWSSGPAPLVWNGGLAGMVKQQTQDFFRSVKFEPRPLTNISESKDITIFPTGPLPEPGQILVPLQQSFEGSSRVLSFEDADVKCDALGLPGVLAKLNKYLGTTHNLDTKMETLLKACLDEEDFGSNDFGRVYSLLRPRWSSNFDPEIALADINEVKPKPAKPQVTKRKSKDRSKSTDQDPVEDNTTEDLSCVVDDENTPRRLWDLYSNRIIPTWTIWRYTKRVEDPNTRAFFAVSHSWVEPKDRQYISDSLVNNCEWPIPIPKTTTLQRIRTELLHHTTHGPEYAWLDVVCLRQENKNNVIDEQARDREWRYDLPNLGAVYHGAQSVVYYLSGLGLPFDIGNPRHERHWLKRAWTLQESRLDREAFIAGITPQSPQLVYTEDNISQFDFQEAMKLVPRADYNPTFLSAIDEMRNRSASSELDKITALTWFSKETSPPDPFNRKTAKIFSAEYSREKNRVIDAFLGVSQEKVPLESVLALGLKPFESVAQMAEVKLPNNMITRPGMKLSQSALKACRAALEDDTLIRKGIQNLGSLLGIAQDTIVNEPTGSLRKALSSVALFFHWLEDHLPAEYTIQMDDKSGRRAIFKLSLNPFAAYVLGDNPESAFERLVGKLHAADRASILFFFPGRRVTTSPGHLWCPSWGQLMDRGNTVLADLGGYKTSGVQYDANNNVYLAGHERVQCYVKAKGSLTEGIQQKRVFVRTRETNQVLAFAAEMNHHIPLPDGEYHLLIGHPDNLDPSRHWPKTWLESGVTRCVVGRKISPRVQAIGEKAKFEKITVIDIQINRAVWGDVLKEEGDIILA